MESFLAKLNESKIMLGLCMIVFNLCSKYLVIDLSKSQEALFKSTVVRRVTVFCIFFVATRDVFTSILLTIGFVVIALNLCHEDSPYNVLPPSFFDTHYTREEYEMAKKIIQEYEKKHVPIKEN
jgi:hypothetical protein